MPAWLDHLVVQASHLPEDVMESLWARGMSSEQASEFRVGYLPTLPEGEYPEEFLAWFHDREDVLLFPLTTLVGSIGGVQVRYRDREKKGYSDFFVTKTEPCLFGLREAAPHIFDRREVILVEGCFDFFPVQRIWQHTIATLTATADNLLLRSLSRVVDKVGCFYDRDKGGERGYRGLREALPHLEVYRVEYPLSFQRKDPGELWEMYGEEWFTNYLKGKEI